MTKTFIIGAGRSGTLTLNEVIGLHTPSVHEHMCTEVERLGTLRYYDMIDKKSVSEKLRDWFEDGDVHVNNKLSWVFPELIDAFPDARFILLSRDGRKVVSSYFNKLSSEAYTSFGVMAQRELLSGMGEPPLQKGYWYPVPKYDLGSIVTPEYRLVLLSWYWGFINNYILDISKTKDIDFYVLKLENVVSNQAVLNWLMIKITGDSASNTAHEFVTRPRNVIVPVDYGMSKYEEQIFFGVNMASLAMNRLGYANKEMYSVKY